MMRMTLEIQSIVRGLGRTNTVVCKWFTLASFGSAAIDEIVIDGLLAAATAAGAASSAPRSFSFRGEEGGGLLRTSRKFK